MGVSNELPAISAHMEKMRDELYSLLVAGLGESRLRINGPPLVSGPIGPTTTSRLPNTLSVGIKGAKAGAILADLSRANIAASASAACHAADAAHAQVSFVLQAMDVPREFALGTLRLSVGRHTSLEEVR